MYIGCAHGLLMFGCVEVIFLCVLFIRIGLLSYSVKAQKYFFVEVLMNFMLTAKEKQALIKVLNF